MVSVIGQIDLRSLLRQSGKRTSLLAPAVLAAIVSRGTQLGVAVVLARQLGPADYGLFVFAIGASLIAAMIGAHGWQLSFNRFFSLARKEANLGKLRGLLRTADRFVVLGCLIAGTVLLLLGFFTDELRTGVIAAAFLTVPFGLMLLRRQQLSATHQAPFALLLDQGFASMVLLAFVLSTRLTLPQIFAVYGLALICGDLAATRLFRRKLPEGVFLEKPQTDVGNWLKAGLALLMGQATRLLLTRFDVLLLPALAGLVETGIYGAAMRVTYVLTFPQFVLQTITTPRFADAFASGRQARARRLLYLSLLFTLVTAAPPLAIIIAAPAWIMDAMFGQGYADGAFTLVLAALGQFAMALAIPMGLMLAMAGHEGQLGKLNFAVLAASLALCLLLIPPYGANGAAAVVLISGIALLFGQMLLCIVALRESPQRHPSANKRNTTNTD